MPNTIAISPRHTSTKNLANAQLSTGIEGASATGRALVAIADIVEGAFKKARTAAVNPDLTPQGKAKARTSAVREASAALEPYSRDVATREAELTRLKATASRTPVAAGDPAEANARQREIREVLIRNPKKPTSVTYFDSITKGAWETTRAIEDSPIPMLDDATRTEGDRLKTERHPLRSEIAAQDRTLAALRVVVNTAKREVEGLSVETTLSKTRFVDPRSGQPIVS